MLDGILNRGFSSKCKSLIKATGTRLEVVRRRAEARQRFLKEDLAKLLANGLDINAYGRTEEFLAGLNLLSCYDFIEQSCDYIVKNLSSMQKQRECPEECREAVASLMFAAARFSDLPELRDVRDLFQERYGSSIECFVNQKFVEKLASRPPIMEKRLQLLQDIASEFSVKWDCRGFQQRMATSSISAQGQANKYGHYNVAADKCNSRNGKGNVAKSDKDDLLPKEMPIVNNIGHRMHHGREGNDLRREEWDLHFYERQKRTANGYKQLSCKGEGHNDDIFHEREESKAGKCEGLIKKDVSSLKVENSNSSSYRKQLDTSGIAYSNQDDAKNDIHGKRENWKPLSHEKRSISPSFGGIPVKNDDVILARENGSSQNEANSLKKVQEEEVGGIETYQNTPGPPPYVKSKSSAIPPPYVKPKDSKQKTSGRPEHAGSSFDEHPLKPPLHNRVNEVNGSDWVHRELDNPVPEGPVNGSTRVRSHEKEHCYQDDRISLPKPRSMRRKHHKSSSNHSDVVHIEDVEAAKRSSSRRRENKSSFNHDDGSHVEDAEAVRRSSSSRRRDHKSSSSYNDVSHVEDAETFKRNSGSRRREHSRKGLQILVDAEHYQKDEEEKMIDKLLLHYSKKPSTYDDVGKSRINSQAHPSNQGAHDTGESSHDRDRNGHGMKPEVIPPPARSISLPNQQSAPSETKKTFNRVNSFQPESQARHVHPKLPDYDDLAARFAALKGR